jgi:hypothetical protein
MKYFLLSIIIPIFPKFKWGAWSFRVTQDRWGKYIECSRYGSFEYHLRKDGEYIPF